VAVATSFLCFSLTYLMTQWQRNISFSSHVGVAIKLIRGWAVKDTTHVDDKI